MYDENGTLIPEDPWSSIVDLMSALVLVLFLVVIFFVTNFSEVSAALEVEKENLKSQSLDLQKTKEKLLNANAQNLDLIAREEKLINEKNSLERQKQQLIIDRDQLQVAAQHLRVEKSELIAEKERLMKDRDILQQASEQLRLDKNNLIIGRDRLIADQKTILTEQADLKSERLRLLAERAALTTEKNNLLGDKAALTSQTTELNAKVIELQAAIREASEKRIQFMDTLADSFTQSKAKNVHLDKEGGKIVLKSEVLFPRGQAGLTKAGQDNLRRVSEGLLRVLNSPKLKKQIEGVMVEGHTSSKGQYLSNLELSAERSLNTLEFLLNLPQIKHSPRDIRRLFFAGAFGESKPILGSRGQEDQIKSRRIEIRLLFNQSHLKSLAHAISN